ncbi:hypothetical protein BD311DRAFT_741302 [Dichomitus squalens]|uniref:Uncharacterized protein n=1 Tax=Dichomitus squalens TaxID=114155 RepID=A0A4Q9MGN2_9APHY|nr:hypothetical protein BD311DRAFT_741302 [Dichomitus squalens]
MDGCFLKYYTQLSDILLSLPHLESLRIKRFGYMFKSQHEQNAHMILDLLHAPSVEVLKLSDGDWDHQQEYSGISRYTSLRSIEITTAWQLDLVLIMQVLSHVRSTVLEDASITVFVLNAWENGGPNRQEVLARVQDIGAKTDNLLAAPSAFPSLRLAFARLFVRLSNQVCHDVSSVAS